MGFGGFASGAIALAGRLSGIPVALHESNRVPGLAIRIMGRFATRVFLPGRRQAPGRRRVGDQSHVGLPVRREIMRLPQAEARTALGLFPNPQGARRPRRRPGASVLNAWTRDSLPQLAAEGIQVYCLTGLDKGKEESFELMSKTGAPVRAVFSPFCDRVAELLSAADLVISRAGAGTLAELIRCETPAILVPFPWAAADHQRANASFFERQGGGMVLEENSIGDLQAETLDVIFNDWLLRKFRENLRRMDRASSLELMLRDLDKMAA